MLIWLYRIAFIPVFLVLFPLYLPRLIRRGNYLQGLWQRFGYYDNLSVKKTATQRLWIQVVSVGEAQAACALIQQLVLRPNCDLVITTTTTTGYALLHRRFSARQGVSVCYFPFDFFVFVRQARRSIQPDLIVLFESELWPELLHQAQRNRIPVWLVNARHSTSSMSWFRRFPYVARWLYSRVNKAFFVSANQKKMLGDLMIQPQESMVTGQLKFDMQIPLLDADHVKCLRDEMGFLGGDMRILMGVSTWPGEEDILLDTVLSLRQSGLDVRLLLIPRHAERGMSILRSVKKSGLSWSQRSTRMKTDKDVIVHIADTTGEMQQLCQCGHIGLVGKSFSPNCGGQTPLELAACGIPMIYGSGMSNFYEICQDLEAQNLAVMCPTPSDAKRVLAAQIQDLSELKIVSSRLINWVQAQKGVLIKTTEIFDAFLGGPF